MRLTWNEIRTRAHDFAADWAGKGYEKGETQTFYDEFFRVFGMERKAVGSFERAVKKLGGGQGFIDLFWPGVLLVEQKSKDRDLGKAEFQAMDYVHAVKQSERPRYVLVSDFQTFRLIDLAEREDTEFPLSDLHKHVEKFGFVIGVERRTFKDQDPVNIQAAELVGKLHDGLEDSGYTGADLEMFLVRIVFCLFADDTGVFPTRDMFLRWLKERTSEDGADLGPKLRQMFEVLNTPDGSNGGENKRSRNLPEAMAAFPYINGNLFEGYTATPDFTSAMRDDLIAACEFDWTPISPAIFGSLFQSVMDRVERRKTGAHYTTEKNIMKVIEPLFLDELRAELDAAVKKKRGRTQALDALSDKLGQLTFFDPACGCGNFLIIAYRELRRLEIDLLKARFPKGTTMQLDARDLSVIDVDQFYGIEIGDFAAKIAETAMWMMDHIMNNELSLAFGQTYARIPLDKAATIVHGDALEVDWEDVLPAKECDYVFGNPPFVGKAQQSPDQKKQTRRLWSEAGGGTVDFVANWFLVAADYCAEGGVNPPHVAFVSTNSITQGEQVSQIWTALFARQMELDFGHQTFEWGSDAKGKARVHCAIVGMSRRENTKSTRRLFRYENAKASTGEVQCGSLSPYLIDADNLPNPYITVAKVSRPINTAPKLKTGVQMIDNGILTFTDDEKDAFVKAEPGALPWFKKFAGGDEFISGDYRWILYLRTISPSELKSLPLVKDRVGKLRDWRLSRSRAATKKLGETPTLVGVDERPENAILVIPNTSSERRNYIPMGWLDTSYVANQKLRILADAEVFEFAVLTSAMHMAWMRTVTGRLESRYMYSVGVVYNTFPWPELTDAAKATLTETGQAILDARAAWPDSTLADLYDPDTMPPNLRRAHQANDRAVDRLYRKRPFESERERVEHLFALYEQLTAPVLAAAKPKPKRRRKRVVKTS